MRDAWGWSPGVRRGLTAGQSVKEPVVLGLCRPTSECPGRGQGLDGRGEHHCQRPQLPDVDMNRCHSDSVKASCATEGRKRGRLTRMVANRTTARVRRPAELQS
jgi:hypothetical protein